MASLAYQTPVLDLRPYREPVHPTAAGSKGD
jgi:hypothetical protein